MTLSIRNSIGHDLISAYPKHDRAVVTSCVLCKNVQRDEETWQAQKEDGDGDGDGLFLRETLVMILRVRN